MTTPDRIWACQGACLETLDEWRDDEGAEYVRRDPAVLAALPEVQALVAAACEIAANIIESPDTVGMTREQVAQGIRARAAAIREGRG